VQIMLKFVKSSVAAAALMGVGLVSPAVAQSASEMAVRMQKLEEQVRQLTGQVQELSFEVKRLQAQGAGTAAPQQSGAAQPVKQLPPVASAPAEQPKASQQKRLAAASAGEPIPESTDIEVIDQQPLTGVQQAPAAAAQAAPATGAAPGLEELGTMDNAAAKPGDGGFQGKVLVPPSQQEPGDEVPVQQGAAPADGNSIETVSLAPDTATETPESLYERSNESLLRRQFGDAEAGFSTFLQKYPEHSLAGSAQYWLGETFYAQGDFKSAAQNFLQGYNQPPRARQPAEAWHLAQPPRPGRTGLRGVLRRQRRVPQGGRCPQTRPGGSQACRLLLLTLRPISRR